MRSCVDLAERSGADLAATTSDAQHTPRARSGDPRPFGSHRSRVTSDVMERHKGRQAHCTRGELGTGRSLGSCGFLMRSFKLRAKVFESEDAFAVVGDTPTLEPNIQVNLIVV